MSVTCALYGASDLEIESLVREPASIHRFLEDAIPVGHPGCLGTLLGQKQRVMAPTRPFFDLGKSWEAVHFVLNGTRSEVPLPEGFITSGGATVGDEDVGYGPARALTAGRVSSIASYLESLTDHHFRSRIDVSKMRPLHIYGAPLTEDPAEIEHFVAVFGALRQFLSERDHAHEGIVIQYV